MKLMRLGPVGPERPVVRLDDTTYIDVSDVVPDFDERFFAGGGLARLASVVDDRRGDARSFGDERIGARASYLEDERAARDAIAGFVLVNDVSERAFQLERAGQWSKGKSAETFNPAGPWLATPDEIEDVMSLGMWLDVNGVRRQTGSTSTMIFDPYFIVRYLSQFMVLEPGDLVNTGTPPGVGMGFTPPVWLQPGDVMELGIDGLGTQRQHALAPR